MSDANYGRNTSTYKSKGSSGYIWYAPDRIWANCNRYDDNTYAIYARLPGHDPDIYAFFELVEYIRADRAKLEAGVFEASKNKRIAALETQIESAAQMLESLESHAWEETTAEALRILRGKP